jgi:hypothetical protein
LRKLTKGPQLLGIVGPQADTCGMRRRIERLGWLAADFRRWVRRHRTGLIIGFAVVVVLLWRPAAWLYRPGIQKLTPDQQVTAIDATRGRVIQFGAGLLAFGALVFTALNFRLSREGHVTDRYTKAIEQLGSERLDVRLGAIYALERIMIDSLRDHPTIVEVLAAYVREHSPRVRPEDQDPDTEFAPRATDVQAAVTVLGRRPSGREEQVRLDLRFTDLTRADMNHGWLFDADLTGAKLTSADLTGAILNSAKLTSAKLTGAYLADASLVGADLTKADLTKADLTSADLRGALLTDADLTSAELKSADLTGADLTGADLTGARLKDADLTDAIISPSPPGPVSGQV